MWATAQVTVWLGVTCLVRGIARNSGKIGVSLKYPDMVKKSIKVALSVGILEEYIRGK